MIQGSPIYNSETQLQATVKGSSFLLHFMHTGKGDNCRKQSVETRKMETNVLKRIRTIQRISRKRVT